MCERAKDFWESEEAKVHGDVSDEAFDEYADRVMKYLQPTPDEVVLDVGCGDGGLTGRIAERSRAKIVGMDFSHHLIVKARVKYPDIEWIEGDALKEWKFRKESFDEVLSFSFLQYIPPSEVSFIFSETKRVLKSGGKAFHLDIPDKSKFFRVFNTFRRLIRGGGEIIFN